MFLKYVSPSLFNGMMTKIIFMTATILFDFSTSEELPMWKVINDGVMGGQSTSQVSIVEEGRMLFSGVVSVENNGGFASCRSPKVDFNLSDHNAIILRILGDGKLYDFRLWTTNRWDGVSYVHSFRTKAGEWQEITLPLKGFKPRFRGQWLNDYPDLDKSQIRQLGFLIADKQTGAFQILIDWVKAE